MQNFILDLQQKLSANTDEANAYQMQLYMKGLFPFLGIKAPKRKMLLKEVINTHKEDVSKNCRAIVEELYQLPEREYHYCAIEIIDKFLKKSYKEEDFEYITALIYTNSHWDTVDFIAKHILGSYLLQFWESRTSHVQQLSNSENKWLNRSAILFQLGYKKRTDVALLFEQCEKHKTSDEFFIQKAIGWALREYGKTDPETVLEFVTKTELKPLSKREALKRLL